MLGAPRYFPSRIRCLEWELVAGSNTAQYESLIWGGEGGVQIICGMLESNGKGATSNTSDYFTGEGRVYYRIRYHRHRYVHPRTHRPISPSADRLGWDAFSLQPTVSSCSRKCACDPASSFHCIQYSMERINLPLE